jgi:signal transduction histidine kinase/CheY-like chemotaxis protein
MPHEPQAPEQQAAEGLLFLAEAGPVLASSLDYEITLASVARLVVPRLADWCTVQIVEEGGLPRQIVVAHVDPAKVEWARELERRYPPDPDSPRGIPAVLRTGQPILAPEITDEQLLAGARDAEHLRILRGLGLKSYMGVPLVARGRTLGAINFVSAESGRRYGPADLALARELARGAALAVDNARLYEEARRAVAEREEAVRLHRHMEERLTLLVEASSRLGCTLQLPDVIAGILDLSHRLIAADAYAIWRHRADAGCWEIVASAGLSADYLRKTGQILQAAQGMPAEPIVSENVYATTVLEARRAGYRAEGIVSLAAYPLSIHGQVSGTLVFYYRSPQRFRDIDVRLGTALANLAGSAIGSADLYTQETQLRLQVEEAGRRKDEFLAMLAHELRNPLAPVLTSLHLINRVETRTERDRVVDVMNRQVRHLARLVDDLLDVSRINRGKIHLKRERLDLTALLRHAVEDRRQTLDAARLRLVLDVPAAPLWARGDATRLAQVLHNLLDNATKFTPAGGEVHVRLAAGRDARQAVLTVRDTGVGIDPEMLPRLFDVFTQADRTLERTRGGLGLGLALVRGLVGLHRGQVQAASAGPGKGAEFTVRLPLEGEAAAAAEPATTAPPTPPRRRVLLIEDNEDAAHTLRLVLEMFGHEVRVAHSGPDGVRTVTAWQPDVVLCDIGLPGMDGYEVARALRRDPRTAGVRLLAITGYGQPQDRRRALEAGFDAHVIKPVDPAELEPLLEPPTAG